MRITDRAELGSAEGSTPHDHLVSFYESDGFLVDAVVAFVVPALEAGDPTSVIATAAHLRAIEDALEARGTDVAAARGSGDLHLLDAHEMLDRLLVDGVADPDAFREVIGGHLERIADEGVRPRLFGEMVAILWERGDVTGAIALEDLWNDLADSHPFELLCAYPVHAFDGEGDAEAFRAVCRRHSTVIPSESYSRLTDDEERRRHVALLQQETSARLTERDALRRQQAELEEALEQLRELDRLRSEFVAMVVHDIRSPAATISGCLDLLSEGWDDLTEGQIVDLLQEATGSTRRIERLADDILTMSHLDSDEFTFDLRPADLGPIVDHATRQIQARTRRRIVVDRPPTLRTALVDEDRQHQVLTNLLTNAVKFSSDDSTVWVTVDDDGDDIVVRVRDEGIGIPADALDDLFRPFSRLERQGVAAEGTGLGLYIARALVEGQGGSISVESTEGRGTTFSYTVLPAGRRP